jgi:GDP-mannose pyrophosphatase NudK
MPKIQIQSKEILAKRWSELALYKILYEKSDGKVEIQVREMFDTGHGVAVLLYNLQKRTVILVEQFRLAAFLADDHGGMLKEVVAGLVGDEDPKKAAIREVFEEVGIEINTVDYLFSAYASPGAKTEKIYFYTASYNNQIISKMGGLSIEQEEIFIHEVNFDLALEGIYNGEIMDAKTIILMLHAKNLFNN